MNNWITAESIAVMRGWRSGSFGTVLADPPFEFPLINDAISEARRLCSGVTMFFMHLEDLAYLDAKPDRVYVWVKPPSPKNFAARFSRFVEAIAMYDVDRHPFTENLYWTDYTGV